MIYPDKLAGAERILKKRLYLFILDNLQCVL